MSTKAIAGERPLPPLPEPAETALAVRMLSEDEKFAIATAALGYGVLSEPDCNLTYGVIEAAIRKFCEVNGIVPLAPQDTGERE